MSLSTGKGFPYPEADDPNNVPLAMGNLADFLDTMPGVSPLTTTQRDALTGGDLWAGRIIFNTTTTLLEQYATGSGWLPVAGRAPQVDTFTASGTWTKPAGATSVQVRVIAGGEGGWSDRLSYGGGGGGCRLDDFSADDLPGSVSVTVGSGGARGSSGGGRGPGGGDSSFGAFLAASGGFNGGGGDPNGGLFYLNPDSVYGGGAGGNTDGNTAAGRSEFGGGGGGNAYSPTTGGGTSTYAGDGGDGSSTGNGSNGSVPGGGGGCAKSAYLGGNGARGQVAVTTYF